MLESCLWAGAAGNTIMLWEKYFSNSNFVSDTNWWLTWRKLKGGARILNSENWFSAVVWASNAMKTIIFMKSSSETKLPDRMRSWTDAILSVLALREHFSANNFQTVGPKRDRSATAVMQLPWSVWPVWPIRAQYSSHWPIRSREMMWPTGKWSRPTRCLLLQITYDCSDKTK